MVKVSGSLNCGCFFFMFLMDFDVFWKQEKRDRFCLNLLEVWAHFAGNSLVGLVMFGARPCH